MEDFAVVNFEKTNCIEAVPSIWILPCKKLCKYPKKPPRNFAEILRNPHTQPFEDWPQWEVKVIKSYGTYEKALKKTKKYIISSDLDTTDGETTTRRAKKLVKTTLPQPLLVPNSSVYPNPPTLARTQDEARALTFEVILDPPPPTTTTRVDLPVVGELLTTVSEISSNSTPLVPVRVQPPAQDPPQVPAPASQVPTQTPIRRSKFRDIDELRREFNEFQAICVENQTSIKEELKSMKTLLQQVLAAGGSTVSKEHLFPDLPIKSQQDLDKLERTLDTPKEFESLVKLLARIGGETVSKNVNNVLRSCVAKELACKLRFTDKSGKVPFGETLLSKAVREAVFMSRAGEKKVSDTTINSFIARWLRNSKIAETSTALQQNQNASTNKTTESKESSSSSDDSDSDVGSNSDAAVGN